MKDPATRIVIATMWLIWTGLTLVWLGFSTFIYFKYSDFGSFIGGGVVFLSLGVVVAGLHYAFRRFDSL